MDLPGDESLTKLVSLIPNREYCICVKAMTKYGEWGPPSVERYISTLPPLFPRVDAQGENWLYVSWDRKEKKFPDSITRYHLQLTGMQRAGVLTACIVPGTACQGHLIQG